MSTKAAANNTLNVVTNGRNKPPKRSFKLSRKEFDPSDPGKAKLNINYVVVTHQTAGTPVPNPTSIATIVLKYPNVTFEILEYKFVRPDKLKLIIWFYAMSTAPLSPGKPVAIKDLVVTINTTDEGTDPDVLEEQP